MPTCVANQFVYAVRDDLKTPVLTLEGNYTLAIAVDGAPALHNTQVVHVYASGVRNPPAGKVGVLGEDTDAILKHLAECKGIQATPYKDGEKYDLIIAAAGLTAKKKAMDTGAPSEKAAPQEAEPAPILPDGALQGVARGTPLLVMAGDESHGRVLARQLAAAGAFKFDGSIPTARASWMENWVVVRSHPLYDGLPTNGVMKGGYQIGVSFCYGLMVDGPGGEVVAAYGRDIGAATFTCKLHGTPVVFQAANGSHNVVEQRWLNNALAYLLEHKSLPQ